MLVDNPFRQMRSAKNLTLKTLADTVGIDSSYLSKIERGIAKPSPLILSELEAALGIDFSPNVEIHEPLCEYRQMSFTDKDEEIDPRNKLNDLVGKEWIKETITVWRQKGLGATHPHTKYERLHPAPFSFQDIARLIRFFTKKGMLVLDPFVGVGSTLKASAIEGRRGLGIELSPRWAELARRRLDEEVPNHSGQQIWCMDIREALSRIPNDSVDFIVTSPPYWAILNKKPDHKLNEVRIEQGLAQSYSDDEKDLGNIPEYNTFLESLTKIFNELSTKLSPGRYCVIIVSDFKHGTRFYPYHSDLYSRIDPKLLELQGITILHQTHKALYPYGYPFAYVPNIHHQYILIFRRPAHNGKSSWKERSILATTLQRPGANGAIVPQDIESIIARFRLLPYKSGSMAGRHWGHQRHSLCSFPSKMKPALASTLVHLFTCQESTVLDPFSGCGTIPFEAALQGRKSIGTDLSTLARIITTAKVDPPGEAALHKMLKELEEGILSTWRDADVSLMEPEIQEFYHQRTAKEIIVAKTLLQTWINNFKENRAGFFITACLAHILHGNRPYALSRRSHNIIPIPPKGQKEYKPVISALKEKVQRMLSFPLPPNFKRGRAFECPAHSLPCETASVDVVITSPSFLGTTHFLRQNRLRNWLVGWDYATQARRRHEFLEHDNTVERYLPVFRELYRVVKPKGLMVFHVGIVKTVSMADLLAPLFAEAGFREIARVWEDVKSLESHGRTDRGGTHTHGFVILRRT